MPIDCNSPKNEQERSLCACQQSTNALVKLLDDYTARYVQYTASVAEYNRLDTEYKAALSSWTSRMEAERSRLGNEDSYRKCGGCGTNQGCQSGWRWDRQEGCGFLGCRAICKRNNDQIDRDMSAWYSANAKPQPPNKDAIVLAVPTAPSNNNIMCCSQIFSDINVEGGSAELSNINQNCSQKIDNAIKAGGSQPSGTSGTSTPSTPSTSAQSTNASGASSSSTSSSPAVKTTFGIDNRKFVVLGGVACAAIVSSSILSLLISAASSSRKAEKMEYPMD